MLEDNRETYKPSCEEEWGAIKYGYMMMQLSDNDDFIVLVKVKGEYHATSNNAEEWANGEALTLADPNDDVYVDIGVSVLAMKEVITKEYVPLVYVKSVHQKPAITVIRKDLLQTIIH